MSYACPKCAAPTQTPGRGDGGLWHCAACDIHFVPGEKVAASFSRPSDFRALLDSLEAAPGAARALRCPRCRAGTFRAVRLKGYALEACSGCGSLVLDPGETPVLRKLGRSVGDVVGSGLNVADAATQLLYIIVRLIP